MFYCHIENRGEEDGGAEGGERSLLVDGKEKVQKRRMPGIS